MLSRLSDETDSNARTVAGPKVNPKKGGAMEQFERMSRLDALRAEPKGDAEDQDAERQWTASLDEEAEAAYLAKWTAFHEQELGIDVDWWWDDVAQDMIAPIPEAYSLAIDAVIAYQHALYKAALAREALKALQEPPDEP